MAPKRPSKNKGRTRTSMWLSTKALRASEKKAARKGISRQVYMEQLLMKDLGLAAADLAEDVADEQPTVFG
jgi:predicted DNA binding CopG/RHH family protein